jgi:hypothetical protein
MSEQRQSPDSSSELEDLIPVIREAFKHWPKSRVVQEELKAEVDDEIAEVFKVLQHKAWDELTADEIRTLWYGYPLVPKSVLTYLLPVFLMVAVTPSPRIDHTQLLFMIAEPGKKGTVRIRIASGDLDTDQKAVTAKVLLLVSQDDWLRDRPSVQRRIPKIIAAIEAS